MRLLLATVCARHAMSVDAQGPQSLKSSSVEDESVVEEERLIDRLGLVDRVVTVVRCTTFGVGGKEG